MDWILKRIWNQEDQPFEIWTYCRHFVKNHLKSGQKCSDFEWSGLPMVGTKAMAILKPDHFKTGQLEIRPSKKSGFQMIPDYKWSDFRCPLYFIQFSNGMFAKTYTYKFIKACTILQKVWKGPTPFLLVDGPSNDPASYRHRADYCLLPEPGLVSVFYTILNISFHQSRITFRSSHFGHCVTYIQHNVIRISSLK